MKLSHLRDVLAVTEAGSLRAAGRQLGLDQPRITRSIREIEKELGAQLFQRHAKGISLTVVGEAFVRRASLIQEELRRGREEIEQLKGGGSGEVAIAMASASAIALMPSILPAFRKRFPQSLLKISESLFPAVEQELMSGQVDFYIGPLNDALRTTKLSVVKLFDNRRLIFARKGHELSGARTLADLAAAQWVRPSFYDEADFEALFEKSGLARPQIVIHSRSSLMTLLSVSNSDLLTMLPPQWLDFPMTAEGVQVIALDEIPQPAPVYIVRRGDLPLTPMAEHLSDLAMRAGMNYDRRSLST